MANSTFKLTYFDMTGRAELIRLLLTAAGKEFEDNRITPEQWQEIKPSSPFGKLPTMEIDGQTYAQSLAIANFIAREFDLYGETSRDALLIDQAAQLMEDFYQCVRAFRQADNAKKAELFKKVKEEDAPKYLAFYEQLIKQNGTGFLAGKSLTMADLVLFNMTIGFLKPFVEDHLDRFPMIRALKEKVGRNERISAYVAARDLNAGPSVFSPCQ